MGVYFRKKGATDGDTYSLVQQTPLFVEPIIAYLVWFVKQMVTVNVVVTGSNAVTENVRIYYKRKKKKHCQIMFGNAFSS